MHAPGVEIRPLRQMTGGASFNEVFFTEVRVRDDHRLGDINNGWNVALTTLMNERAAIGAGGGGGGMYSHLIKDALVSSLSQNGAGGLSAGFEHHFSPPTSAALKPVPSKS